jgi:predicted PhzF superfamily epimerase YddE/YHI9
MTDVLRYAAFTDDPAGGNPAGIVLDAAGLDETRMLAIAAEVGFSETAFLLPVATTPAAGGDVTTARAGAAGARPGAADEEASAGRVRAYRARYFSPRAEVPFCGHATVATAVALAERHGPGRVTFDTMAGTVPVDVVRGDDGRMRATLTSVPTRVGDLPDDDLDELLAALDWRRTDLDPALPPRVAYAGAFHPVIAAGSRARLGTLDYDVDRLLALMLRRNWCGGRRPSATTCATRSPSAACTRTPPPVRRRPPSAATCGSWVSCRRPRG